MSPMYRQSCRTCRAQRRCPPSHACWPAPARVPRISPDSSIAKSTGALPESLCVQSSPGCRRLTARPLASGTSRQHRPLLARCKGLAVPSSATATPRPETPRPRRPPHAPSFQIPVRIAVPVIADKLPRHAESDCGKDSANDDHGLAAAAELVYGKPGEPVVPRRDGDLAVPRAVCRRAVGVSAGAGSGGAGHRHRRRLPVQPGHRRPELDELSAEPHGRVRHGAPEAGGGGGGRASGFRGATSCTTTWKRG